MSDLFPTTHAVPIELASGATLQQGRFVVQRTLGRGGFGITYAAHDHRLQRQVALKELFCDGAARHGGVVTPPSDGADAFAAAKDRFLREASVLARFTDPGIVRVYEVFEEAGTAYLVMELLEGSTLYDFVLARGGPLTESEVRSIARRSGDALAVVHRAGILHRDLNPSNVMLTGDGRVVLIDFGLAREFTVDEATPMTRMVTPGYAPPEQYAVDARCGPPADVYGLAATLYWALTSRAPTPAIDRQTGTALVAPHRIISTVSKSMSDGVLDGLELNAGHRPQTIESFLPRIGMDPPGDAIAPSPVPPSSHAPSAHVPAPPEPDRQATRVEGTRALPPPPAPAPSSPLSGRRKATAPLLVLAVAIGALLPVLGLAIAALVVLPAVATLGDAIVYVRLRRAGERLHWKHRAALPAYVPARFVRNIGRVLLAGVPALLLIGASVALALMLDGLTSTTALEDWVLRVGGAGAMAALVTPVFRDRTQFRAALVLDSVADRALDGDRLTAVGQGLWVVAVLFAAAALAFRPDLFPF